MHSLSSVVFCLSIHNNPYICFSKNLLTFNALTLYYFYMKEISTILWMAAIWMIGLMPVRAAAGALGSDLQGEKGKTVICRGVEAHTSGPMIQVGQVAPDFHAVNAKMEEVYRHYAQPEEWKKHKSWFAEHAKEMNWKEFFSKIRVKGFFNKRRIKKEILALAA